MKTFTHLARKSRSGKESRPGFSISIYMTHNKQDRRKIAEVTLARIAPWRRMDSDGYPIP